MAWTLSKQLSYRVRTTSTDSALCTTYLMYVRWQSTASEPLWHYMRACFDTAQILWVDTVDEAKSTSYVRAVSVLARDRPDQDQQFRARVLVSPFPLCCCRGVANVLEVNRENRKARIVAAGRDSHVHPPLRDVYERTRIPVAHVTLCDARAYGEVGTKLAYTCSYFDSKY